jgi:outer membrane immunogenic protein
MKKFVIALATAAALTSPALAADMAAKAPMRAAPVAYAPSWTGCYVGGGGGYGMWNQENTQFFAGPPVVQVAATQTNGGRGYFGTVGGGCDYQFPLGTWNMVVGAFGDYDFASMKGEFSQQIGNLTGTEKLSSQWSVGGRIGWVATPNLLVYFSGGYTEAKFDRINLHGLGAPVSDFIPGQTYKGYFLGAGDEYALNFLPGLFWKTEYRFSDLDTQRLVSRSVATGLPNGDLFDSHKYVHTVRSELVYRFNWGGAPISAKY